VCSAPLLKSSYIQTVTGPIATEDLGPALMHEHLLINLAPPAMREEARASGRDKEKVELCDCFKLNWGQKVVYSNYVLEDDAVMLAELAEMAAAGGRALVELTVGGLKPDPNGLARLAEKSGIHIVMGCGHYVEDYQEVENFDRTAEHFAQEMIEHLTVGAWGTDIKAGIIGEIGCQWPWTDLEKRVMRGALLAQQETGAAINAHPGRSVEQPFELASFLREFGADPGRFIISHLDRTFSEEEDFLRLADTGCVIELDLFGMETTNYLGNPDFDMPNDGMRLKAIRKLIDHGHLDRIVISHDICMRARLCKFGGHGYQHIFANVVPLMLRRSFQQEEIDAILTDNPARLLTLS
jgi:phosphotriesterase-related protein